MNKSIWNASYKEWTCRILLTCNVVLTIDGLTSFVTTEYELLSPLLSKDLVLEIARPIIYSSIVAGCVLLVSLWLYFFQKHLTVLILQALLLLAYLLGMTAFFAEHFRAL